MHEYSASMRARLRGFCHRAPMARIDDTYRESLDADARQRLIAELSGSTNGRTP